MYMLTSHTSPSRTRAYASVKLPPPSRKLLTSVPVSAIPASSDSKTSNSNRARRLSSVGVRLAAFSRSRCCLDFGISAIGAGAEAAGFDRPFDDELSTPCGEQLGFEGDHLAPDPLHAGPDGQPFAERDRPFEARVQAGGYPAIPHE